jgi:hypothetical protein
MDISSDVRISLGMRRDDLPELMSIASKVDAEEAGISTSANRVIRRRDPVL